MNNAQNSIELSMGQKLKMLREINELSQDELGKKLNVSDKTISAWENEEREISLNDAKAICELFDVPNSYFVFNENFNSINYELQNRIKAYLEDYKLRSKIEKILNTCKQKISDDGITFKKDFLPAFDFNKKDFVSFGLFDEKGLPIEKHGSGYNSQLCFNESNLENKNFYKYSSSKLAEFGLCDILNKYNSNDMQLSDLVNCNNIEMFKLALEKTKAGANIKKESSCLSIPVSKENYLQNELNKALENLNPNLSKFWEIIIFLIDNGAYYTKQTGWGDDIVCWKNEKDVSKTNLVYRLAKDNISKLR